MAGLDTRGPDILIGGIPYRFALGVDAVAVLGKTVPLEFDWQSLFERGPFSSREVPGSPDVIGLKPDLLRFQLDRFDGGEGQLVFRPADAGAETRYLRSSGIDLSVPGSPRLAKDLKQQGSTGSAVTTREGSDVIWTTFAGIATIVGTDRRLDTKGVTVVEHSMGVLAAGRYALDLSMYLEGPVVILGQDLHVLDGNADVVGTTMVVKSLGATVQTTQVAGLTNGRKWTWHVHVQANAVPGGGAPHGKATVRLDVWNDTDDEVVRGENSEVNISDGTVALSIQTAELTSKNYRGRLTFVDRSGDAGQIVAETVEIRDEAPHEVQIDLLEAAAVIQTSTVDLTDREATSIIAHLTWPADGVSTYKLHVKYVTGDSQRPIVDKDAYYLVGMNAPWIVDLGIDGEIWLVDNDPDATVPPSVFWWDAANLKWQVVDQLGAVFTSPVAMAHSDRYGYVLLDDGTVWSFDKTGTDLYSAAIAEDAAGLAVTDNRLYVLGEDATLGTNLYSADLDSSGGALPVAVTSVYQIADARPAGDQALPRRMTALTAGVIFFVNEGLRCRLHVYDPGAAAGAPFMVLPPGFQGRAVQHMLGTSYVAGQFPATDLTGDTQPRPALFALDHLSTGTGLFREVPVRLWRDEDVGSEVNDAQLYGTDLYLIAGVHGDAPAMRIWRVDLALQSAFCSHELALDSSQVAGTPRSVALDWSNLIATWSIGNPYVRVATYPVNQEMLLYSSVFANALLEEKQLLRIQADAVVPVGTTVRVYYLLDDDTGSTDPDDLRIGLELTHGHHIHAGGRVSTPDDPVMYGSYQLVLGLTTTDPAVTPEVRRFGSQSYVAAFDTQYPVALECLNEEPPPSANAKGWELRRNIFDLAAAGSVVDVVLLGAVSPGNEADAPQLVCIVQDPHAYLVGPGEFYVTCTLVET